MVAIDGKYWWLGRQVGKLEGWQVYHKCCLRRHPSSRRKQSWFKSASSANSLKFGNWLGKSEPEAFPVKNQFQKPLCSDTFLTRTSISAGCGIALWSDDSDLRWKLFSRIAYKVYICLCLWQIFGNKRISKFKWSQNDKLQSVFCKNYSVKYPWGAKVVIHPRW